MGEKRGCFKTGCLGCLGVLGIGIIMILISGLVAWRGASNKEVVNREITAPTEVTSTEAEVETVAEKGGKLVLQLNQGEFHIHPGQPGSELLIKANFDDDIYNLEDRFTTLEDSTWVYEVRFYRTIGGLQALMRQIAGGGHDNSLHVFIPPDLPIELVIDSEEGGFEAELGGLWLTSADIDFDKGGFELEISKPLKEPMESFMISTSMGGFDASGIGNASPKVMNVSCSMGGGQVGLDGNWLNDCAARMSVKMGGMAIVVPDDIIVVGADVQGDEMLHTDGEVNMHTLSLSLKQSMGEIEVVR